MKRILHNDRQKMSYEDVFYMGRVVVEDVKAFKEVLDELEIEATQRNDYNFDILDVYSDQSRILAAAYQDFALLFHGIYDNLYFSPTVLEVEFDDDWKKSEMYATFFHALNLKQYGSSQILREGKQIFVNYDGCMQTRSVRFDFRNASDFIVNEIYQSLQNLKTD